MAGNISNDCYSGTNNLVGIEPEKLAALIAKYEQWAKMNKVLLHEEVEKQMPYKF
ncbi:MAG: hypothetical protein GTN68_45315 [Candidatus Aminicenantes bacterium]|nr:hypothetical protein [Candidatus Aminicenantes bacterium]